VKDNAQFQTKLFILDASGKEAGSRQAEAGIIGRLPTTAIYQLRETLLNDRRNTPLRAGL
jgi:hypothetical protein